MFKDYLVQNWALILILSAFAIMLKTTVFLDEHRKKRMYFLVAAVFALSVVVYVEFYLETLDEYTVWRSILMAVRYSATPLIISPIICSLLRKRRFLVFIPAAALLVIDVVSIFTGIVFRVNADNTFTRGPLGLLPFIVAGLYFALLIYILIDRSNKRATEIIPIAFLTFSFVTGLILPFILGKAYSQIFCTTVSIAAFVYYVFTILQLTKKDPLTGLLNRQAYYSDVVNDPDDITAVISLDMNGLKVANDTYGHAAGDEALFTLASCFLRAVKRNQSVYRIGGDEFVIICRKTDYDAVVALTERIKEYVSETKYTCSLGYCHCEGRKKTVDELLKKSDEMMYAEKARYYAAERRE